MSSGEVVNILLKREDIQTHQKQLKSDLLINIHRLTLILINFRPVMMQEYPENARPKDTLPLGKCTPKGVFEQFRALSVPCARTGMYMASVVW